MAPRWPRRWRRLACTAWALTTVATLTVAAAGEAQPASVRQPQSGKGDLAGDSDLLVDDFLHVQYNFALQRANMHREGTGELWLSFKDDIPRIRLKGKAHSPRFGDGEITIVIDGGTKTMYVKFKFTELHELQCIRYPFPRVADNAPRMERLRWRRQQVLKWQMDEESLASPSAPMQNRKLQVQWTKSNFLEFLLGTDKQVLGIDLRKRGQVIKTVRMVGVPERAAAVPRGTEDMFGPPAASCVPEDVEMHPLAKLDLIPPHRKSSALNDLLLVLADRAPAGPGQWPQFFVMISALTMPGDVAVMIEDPEPPDFRRMGSMSFNYNAEVVRRGMSHTSNGSIWLDLSERTFRLRGEAKKTKVGPLVMDLVAQGDYRAQIYANVNLTAQEEQQCVAYGYPSFFRNDSGAMRGVSEGGLAFSHIAELRGEDCSIFKAPLARGRWIYIWADMEDSRPDAVLRSEIRKGRQVLRTSDLLNWHSGSDVPVAARPKSEWACSKAPATGQLAHLSLHEVHKRSMELQDTLYALRELNRDFALLEILGLTGDVAIMVQEPEMPDLRHWPSVSFHYSLYLGPPQADLSTGFTTHTVGSFAADMRRGRVRVTANSRTPGGTNVSVALNPGALAVRIKEAGTSGPQCQLLPISSEEGGGLTRFSADERFPDTSVFSGVEQIGGAVCNRFTFRSTGTRLEQIDFWFSVEEESVCGIQVLPPDGEPRLATFIDVPAWEPIYAPGSGENDPYGEGLAAAPGSWDCREVMPGEGGQWLSLQYAPPSAALPIAASVTKLAKAAGVVGLLPLGYRNILSRLVVLDPSSMPDATTTTTTPAPAPVDIFRNELRTFMFTFTSTYPSQGSSGDPWYKSPAGPWTRNHGRGELRVDLAKRRLYLRSEAVNVSAGIPHVESRVIFRGDTGRLWARTKIGDFEQCWSVETTDAVPPPRGEVSPNPFRRGQLAGRGFSVPGPEDKAVDKYVFYIGHRKRIELFVDSRMSLAAMNLDNLDRDASVGILVDNWSTDPIDEAWFQPSRDWKCEDLRFLESSAHLAEWDLIRLFFPVDPIPLHTPDA